MNIIFTKYYLRGDHVKNINPEILMSQILPVLSNPKHFEDFLASAPLSQDEKKVISQIYKKLSSNQSIDSIPQINSIIDKLLGRINQEQANNLNSLKEVLAKMSPDDVKALQSLLKNTK